MTNSLSVGRPLLLLPGPLEHQPGDVSLSYAEVLADGVGCSMATSNLTTIDNSWLVPTPITRNWFSEVPAASLRKYRAEARKEVGESCKVSASRGNDCRDAHRFIKR